MGSTSGASGDATALAEALLKKHAAIVTTQGPRCSLEGSPHRAIVEALFARKVSRAAIARIMTAEYGVTIRPDTVRRHCQQLCRCPR